jgi:hypothetical protein
MFNTFFKNILYSPKKFFLIDSFGAITSAFMLGYVLVKLENVFGIPKTTLYLLAFFPCVFVVYDICCYLRVKKNISFYLKSIAYMNIFYCCISIGLAFYHYEKITYWGWIYLIFEVLIVITISYIEIKTAHKLKYLKNSCIIH